MATNKGKSKPTTRTSLPAEHAVTNASSLTLWYVHEITLPSTLTNTTKHTTKAAALAYATDQMEANNTLPVTPNEPWRRRPSTIPGRRGFVYRKRTILSRKVFIVEEMIP